jgi:hypothetical protein
MQVWIVIYEHRHGIDVFPWNRCPTEEEVISTLEDWEPDRDETIDIRGPYDFLGT